MSVLCLKQVTNSHKQGGIAKMWAKETTTFFLFLFKKRNVNSQAYEMVITIKTLSVESFPAVISLML